MAHQTTEALAHNAASPAMVADLAAIVGSKWVRTSEVDRLAYNSDCWPRNIILTRGRKLWRDMPAAIVQPKNDGEVAAIVQWARRTGTPIVPFGAGSGVCGGAMADEHSVTVDMKRMKRIVETRPEDMTLRAETGIIGMLLQRELERRGLTLGHFPSSLYCSSLGGYLAARSAGQCSSRYGKMEDMVLSMRVIAGTGQSIETAPDPLAPQPRQMVPEAGPDLTQLLVGSEGTLGLITQATLRVEPQPDHRFYRGFQFPNVSTALEAIRETLQLGLRPTVTRLYDAVDTFLAKGKTAEGSAVLPAGMVDRLRQRAVEAMPAGWKSQLRRTVDRAGKMLLGRIVGQPLVLNSLVDILPTECLMVVGFEGTSSLTEEEALYAFDILGRYGLDLGVEPGMHWLRNRYAVSYKQSPTYDTGAFVDTMEVSTTWNNLLPLYEAVRAAMSPYVVVMAHFSHVYPEGSSIYFTFAGFAPDVDSTVALYEAAWRAGLDAVAEAGGSIAHHHGVGRSKAAWTHHDHPGGQALFQSLKEAFDPDGIMNPGKVYSL